MTFVGARSAKAPTNMTDDTLADFASVIIPVYNDREGILSCLATLDMQTRAPDSFEVIVVDNGSDAPLQPDRNYRFSMRLIRCDTPGSYAARNAGLEAAVGDIFAFTDADCRPDPKWLEQGCCRIDADSSCIVGGEVIIELPHRPSAVALYQTVTGFGQQANVRDKGFSATANLFCRRSDLEKIGPFDQRLLSGGDREWCWRAAKNGIGLCFEPRAVVYTNPRSSLRGATRQARRVVAGRVLLRNLGLAHIGGAAVAKHRSAWQSVTWILSNRRLRIWDRLRVLLVAIVIRGAAALESIKLASGANPERR